MLQFLLCITLFIENDSTCIDLICRLFGPRKKMTNAIARWQSKAPLPASNKIEQAYADRLEGEMQEMALQLHKVKCELQLNLSITTTQWRSKKWPLQAGDLYIEGPSSAGHFIYFLSYKLFPF